MTTTQVLIPHGQASITISAQRDPNEYYREREGFWVWSDMRRIVAENAKPVPAGTTFNVKIADINRRADTETIERALSAGRPFDESAVCAIIAELIEEQKSGEPGVLLTNGYGNLFPLATHVVATGLSFNGRGRGVSTLSRNGLTWSAGHRIFSLV